MGLITNREDEMRLRELALQFAMSMDHHGDPRGAIKSAEAFLAFLKGEGAAPTPLREAA